MLLGRTGSGWIDTGDPTTAFLSEVGFAMLMFVVGTSLPLRDPGLLGFGASALAALLTLVFAVPAGFGLALVGPDRPLVLAVVIATSSAAVARPILQGFNGSDATATTGSAHGINAAGGLAAAFARDQAMAPQCSGQPPDERGEYRPVRPVQANTARSAQSKGGLGLARRRAATSWRSTSSSTSLEEGGRPSSRTSPSTCRKIRYRNRRDTAVIVPECRSTPITAGHGRTRHSGNPQGTSCFAVLVDHVPATAQAARTVRVSCAVTSPGKTDQSEGHRPLDGAACRIARLTHAYDLARIGEGLLDSPPRRITGHQIFRGRFQIGGDQWKPITTIVTSPGPRLVAANQNDPHSSAAKRSVPQADPFGDLHGVGAPVPTDLAGAPGLRGGGEGGDIGRGAQPGTAGAWSARASGAGLGSSCSTEVTFRRLVQLN